MPSPLAPPPAGEDWGDGEIGPGEVVGIMVAVGILLGIFYYERNRFRRCCSKKKQPPLTPLGGDSSKSSLWGQDPPPEEVRV